MTKFPQRERGQESGRNFKIKTLICKFGTGEARNLKFGIGLDLGKSIQGRI